jgi:hypothetical protein
LFDTFHDRRNAFYFAIKAGSSRTPSNDERCVDSRGDRDSRVCGGGACTDAVAALKTTAAISVTSAGGLRKAYITALCFGEAGARRPPCPDDLDSLGSECNHGIDSRRTPGRETTTRTR